ncbi:hypothetical protein Tco_0156714 [Tanacetum coccineum]
MRGARGRAYAIDDGIWYSVESRRSRRLKIMEEISSKGQLAIDEPGLTGSIWVKESPDAPMVEELASDDKLEKKTIFPTVAKIEFVRPKQQEKPVRKPVKYSEMYRSQSPRLTAITIKGKGWYLGIIIQSVPSKILSNDEPQPSSNAGKKMIRCMDIKQKDKNKANSDKTKHGIGKSEEN